MEQKILNPEFVLNVYLDKLMIVQPSDLEHINAHNYFDADSPCQLYFICKRPKITVDPDSFDAAFDKLELTFEIHYPAETKKFDFVFENPFYTKSLTLESEPPHSSFTIKRLDEPVITVKTSAFLQSFPQEAINAGFLDLEILFIGQTLGVDGADVKPKKLKDHLTLQTAYDTAVKNNPDSEICVLLASFLQHSQYIDLRHP